MSRVFLIQDGVSIAIYNVINVKIGCICTKHGQIELTTNNVPRSSNKQLILRIHVCFNMNFKVSIIFSRRGFIMNKRLWTREEEIVVFNLYCKIPFNKSSKFHPEVIKIAELIKRTPSAVNMKIGNFGRFDEELKKRNISGLSNGSKLDEEIWNEFNEKWDDLVYESEMILSALKQGKILDKNKKIFGQEIERTVKQRINQDFFRSCVLASYEGSCCVTGLATDALLVASHIKPWKVCSGEEKTNPQNGLCLNALHDKAFDRGYMTVDLNYRIHISDEIRDIFCGDTVEKYFKCYDGQSIILPEKFLPKKMFLEYHNDMIFESWKRNSLYV